jgi:hypothetical protein
MQTEPTSKGHKTQLFAKRHSNSVEACLKVAGVSSSKKRQLKTYIVAIGLREFKLAERIFRLVPELRSL